MTEKHKQIHTRRNSTFTLLAFLILLAELLAETQLHLKLSNYVPVTSSPHLTSCCIQFWQEVQGLFVFFKKGGYVASLHSRGYSVQPGLGAMKGTRLKLEVMKEGKRHSIVTCKKSAVNTWILNSGGC